MSTEPIDLAANLLFVEAMFERFSADPQSVDASWRALFQNGHVAPSSSAPSSGGQELAAAETLARVVQLVNAYRQRGHLEAKLDPLEHLPAPPHPDLDPKSYGFGESDLDRVMPIGSLFGFGRGTLREILTRLRATYCGSIGVECMYITDLERRYFLPQRIEPTLNQPNLQPAEEERLYELLVRAEEFESFIHTKYVGTKRFSLEGGETLIPLLDEVIERSADHGIDEMVVGMAHRGRLNVLVNTIGKRPGEVFAEFEDLDPESMMGGGDVKYHLGYSSDRKTQSGKKVHLSLTFNPSHLEAVDPVVVGRVRAKQRRRRDIKHEHVLGVLIHGDAAFAGQGLVPETLNLSNLHGYRTGGTVHVIVNNQIGFTTAPKEARSTYYCSDVAKMIQVPIFHVNGEDPDAVIHTVRLALDYRRQFHSDVVIDMFCFRKYGHNEGDEPAFTQPRLYQKIEEHPSVRQVYRKRLVDSGRVSKEAIESIEARVRSHLESEFAAQRRKPKVESLGGYWEPYVGGFDRNVPEVPTSVTRARLLEIGQGLTTVPDGFRLHPKVQKLLAQRAQMGKGEQLLDWAMGEAMAFGSLVTEGFLVRLSGQDCGRGTFSQRHAVLVDQRTEEEYVPLSHLRTEQAFFRVYDSPLSEAGVMGFEFGYSLDYPDALIMWEAQFGDFVNGAQMIIDQFLTSSEDKWKRLSGLTLLLPHGYEGQGPEHSSARFERFLGAAGEDNIQVCYPSNPAQYFHLLRRQVLRKWRKPLVVLTPKSLLRLPAARSSLEDLELGTFRRILWDPEPGKAGNAVASRDKVRRIILCTGKIYYDLAEERTKRSATDVVIVRIEQLYPLPDDELARAFDHYIAANELIWVQEEPANMGAAGFLHVQLLRMAGHRAVRLVCRDASASPATGSYKAHNLEQRRLVAQAFAPLSELP